MPVAYTCPFFKKERNDEIKYVICEVGCIRFKDAAMRRQIAYKYCAHPEGYKECPVYRALVNYYERNSER